jgi:hypothetical protein
MVIKEESNELHGGSFLPPEIAWPRVANYAARTCRRLLPYRLHNGLGFLAAQTAGHAVQGAVGGELSLEQGTIAAQTAALNALARIYEALVPHCGRIDG